MVEGPLRIQPDGILLPKEVLCKCNKISPEITLLDTIKKHKGDSKALFAITNKLLHRGQQLPLPPCKDTKSLADSLNKFYHEN